MSYVNPIWLEGQRKRWLRPDAHLWVRHDAHRFLTPAGIEEQKRAAEAEKTAHRKADAAADAAEVEAFFAEHFALRRELAELKFEFAWRQLCRKYGYSPDQPRDELGRWTGDGTGALLGLSGPCHDRYIPRYGRPGK